MRFFQNITILCWTVLAGTSCFAQSFQLEFIGEVNFQTGYSIDSLELGGLSGITYDPVNHLFYCISDDYSREAPARFFTFRINLTDGRLDSTDVKPVGVQILEDINHQPFMRKAIDGEGIAFSKSGIIYISSEGSRDTKHQPFIRKYTLDGSFVAEIALPVKFIPTPNRDYGIRQNLGPESLCLTPEEDFLFTASEQALAQDGSQSYVNRRSPARLVRFDLRQRSVASEYLYWVDPVVWQPVPADAICDNGLVDLLALSPTSLIGLERSYSQGVGSAIRLYEIFLQAAENIATIERFDRIDLAKIIPAKKTLLLDLLSLGIHLDNIEGLTFGPLLPDGRQSLILVSDNNFNVEQVTQFLAFAVATKSKTYPDLDIGQIQGRGHISPFRDCKVSNVTGVVTAVSQSSKLHGIWMQSEINDQEIATSEGVFVLVGKNSKLPQVGDKIAVTGKVSEKQYAEQLPRTVITCKRFKIVAIGQPLPEPVVIGKTGRSQPTKIIDDDKLTRFEPAGDGIDFYESLEGMRVAINNPVIVGLKNRFDECVVLADRGKQAGLRTPRGGILLQENDFNPERIVVRGSKANRLPAGNVGDHFIGRLTGILDYSFGNYKLVLTEPPPLLVRRIKKRETTALRGANSLLHIASFNVENLDFNDKPAKFLRLAGNIVTNLGAPDILALQEVQDDTGPNNDGTVEAIKTLQRLIHEIKKAGGPAYKACQINPEDNADGGQPGGNIRVAFLFNPERVLFKQTGKSGPWDQTKLDSSGALTLNPGRIFPTAAAFKRSRKPLVVEFVFNKNRIFLINVHLNSKGGDGGLWGASQPPRFRSEKQRIQQTHVIRNFVTDILNQNPRANVIVLGDMNEFEFRKPMRILAGNDLVDLITRVPLAERYTYIYEGNSQVLDHILVSKHLVRAGNCEVDIVHINSEFTHNKRTSDHDPVVALLQLGLEMSGASE